VYKKYVEDGDLVTAFAMAPLHSRHAIYIHLHCNVSDHSHHLDSKKPCFVLFLTGRRGKGTPGHHTIKTYGGVEVIASCILNLDTRMNGQLHTSDSLKSSRYPRGRKLGEPQNQSVHRGKEKNPIPPSAGNQIMVVQIVGYPSSASL
jgi:hypothetical protein